YWTPSRAPRQAEPRSGQILITTQDRNVTDHACVEAGNCQDLGVTGWRFDMPVLDMDARDRRQEGSFLPAALQGGFNQVGVAVELREPWHDTSFEPVPAVVEASNSRPRPRPHRGARAPSE